MRFRPADTLLFLSMKLLKSLDRRESELKHLDPDKVRSILVVSSTAIGDTLLSTPAIRAVRERYPQAKIIAHFNARNMELFADNPHIDGIIPYHGGYRKFFRTIREFRKHRFDLALIFHGNEPQATPMAYLSGARFIVKLPNKSEFAFLLSNRDDEYGWEDFAHGVDQRLKVAELAGCTIGDRRMVLPLHGEGEAAVDAFFTEKHILPGQTVIGFQPGASTASRMWFPGRFVELGKALVKKYPELRIVITGSPDEYTLCSSIAEGIGHAAAVAAGKLPLRYVPNLLKRFERLVTGDTGIMHMAIAVDTPVLALFAVADPRKSGPYYDLDRHVVLKKPRTCDPCLSKKCAYQQCMEQISVEEVMNTLAGTLGKQS
ncbi:MAG: glycosyltransferase family 9 protein [Geobacter sp.]|nr:glycosyltransferase family 9 protein [Geobacter sp.]